MTEDQKLKKKKNALIILFMILLVVFVCIMCGIFIYAKMNPPIEFLSPDEIEIKQMATIDRVPTTQNYTVLTESTSFTVTENNQDLELVLTEEHEVKLLKEGTEQSIEIMQNDKNINNNIKLIYQKENNSLILTESGELYKLIDNQVNENRLKVGRILTNIKVNNIVSFAANVDGVYVLNENSKLINIDNQKEYTGIIKEIKTSTTTIYIYEDYSFGVEEGKIFVNENNNPLKISISFDNKIITESNVVYEISATDNKLSTSSLGEFRTIGYSKNEDGSSYLIATRTTTGDYEFNSSYYYSR